MPGRARGTMTSAKRGMDRQVYLPRREAPTKARVQTCIRSVLARESRGNTSRAGRVYQPTERRIMATTKEKKEKRTRSVLEALYDLSTPVLDRYYREARKRVKFPRYYKRALNW